MNTAIILAAGKGSRMNMDINKQFIELFDKPVIAYSIEAFEICSAIDEIILIAAPDEEDIFKTIIEKFEFKKVSKIVAGGSERQASVRNGIEAVTDSCDVILIHDGARPLVKPDLIIRCAEAAKIHGAASAGVPVKDTIKIIAEDQTVTYTPKRKNLWATQTPQAFRADIIKRAHDVAAAKGTSATDDAILVELMGVKVNMVESDYENIKITTPEDIMMAEAILKNRR